MIDSLHNNSQYIGVRINGLENNAHHNDFDDATKITLNDRYWVWKVVLPYDYVVSLNSCLVSANRSNNSPFGGPLEEGETRVVSYSLNQGKSWTNIQMCSTVNI